MTDFGYDSDKPCVFCGERPAQVEPRFGYAACQQHAGLPPTSIGKVCIVGCLTGIRPHPARPDLRLGEIAGHTVVVGDHYVEGNPGFHIPVEAVLTRRLLEEMWLWNINLNKGRLGGKGGGRVKARAIDDVQSDGLFYGAYYFKDGVRDDPAKAIWTPSWRDDWRVGDDVSTQVGITFQE